MLVGVSVLQNPHDLYSRPLAIARCRLAEPVQLIGDGTQRLRSAGDDLINHWMNFLLTILPMTGVFTILMVRWSDARKDQRTYQREKAAREDVCRDRIIEKRNEFQRQTLLELQNAIHKLMTACYSYTHCPRKGDEWINHEDDLRESVRICNAETTKLGVRV